REHELVSCRQSVTAPPLQFEAPSPIAIATSHTLARRAVIALGANAIVNAASGVWIGAALTFYELGLESTWYEGVAWVLVLAESAALLAGAITFLGWLRGVFRLAPQLRVRGLLYSGRDVARGFFIPVLSFYVPYRGIAALARTLDPRDLPEPPPR